MAEEKTFSDKHFVFPVKLGEVCFPESCFI